VWTAKNALSFDPVDDSWNQRDSGNLDSPSSNEPSGREVWDVLRQGGAKSAKANEERASYDLSLDTVKEMAIAFTCLEAETSSAGLWDLQDGVLGRRVVNPGALALFLAIQEAYGAKRRLTFGDFRKMLDNVITTHNDLEQEIRRRYPDELEPRGLQTPAYLSNANGLIIYDPERADANGGN
ncbi:MAG: hypothetical protein IJO46_02950, partial [Thermoguttaceae bacterium]|nr:hypothetical protein [Thermoguttaceae bacterium]